MEDKVDILLTTYNTKIEYLKMQIDSILNQTYKNFTLIISDDCSPNKEVRTVLKEYEQKDDRIKLYFQEKNLGYTKNFEFALTKSTAEYIAFSDHDDIWYDNKIEESLKILKEKDVDLVYCDAKQIDENGKVLHESYLRYKNMPVISGKDLILLFSRHIAIGCSQMFTRDVKEKILPFTENTMAHDWNTEYIANRLKGIYCIDKVLFEYRLHGNNAFGGRSFKQNMKIWKEENGNSYKSYLKYRNRVITDTYLAGVLMCKEYSLKIENNKLQKQENEVIEYFKESQKHNIIYFPVYKYFKYLNFKGIGKRKYKEIMILHFSLISYIIFALI
ncbi:MAG: glycosyltransferase [Clostridia bacterium]|nr:glycosyltransferase [Clostridia bacterium]